MCMNVHARMSMSMSMSMSMCTHVHVTFPMSHAEGGRGRGALARELSQSNSPVGRLATCAGGRASLEEAIGATSSPLGVGRLAA